MLDFLEKLFDNSNNKQAWLLFFLLYVFILFNYFSTNNIPVQFDSNIVILIVIFFILMLFVIWILYIFLGGMERILMLLYKGENKKNIFSNYDMHVLFITIPFFIIALLVEIDSNGEENLSYITKVFFGFLLYYIFSFTMIMVNKYKKIIYINSIIFSIGSLYVIFNNNGNFIVFLFIFFTITLLIYFYLHNEDVLDKNIQGILHDTKIYSFFKQEFKPQHTERFKISFMTLLIFITLILFTFDKVHNKDKINNFITTTILSLSKIGSFPTTLTIDNKVKSLFDKNIYDENDNTFKIDVLVLWENDTDIYIKYDKRSIKIHQNFVVANEYIEKKRNELKEKE